MRKVVSSFNQDWSAWVDVQSLQHNSAALARFEYTLGVDDLESLRMLGHDGALPGIMKTRMVLHVPRRRRESLAIRNPGAAAQEHWPKLRPDRRPGLVTLNNMLFLTEHVDPGSDFFRLTGTNALVYTIEILQMLRIVRDSSQERRLNLPKPPSRPELRMCIAPSLLMFSSKNQVRSTLPASWTSLGVTTTLDILHSVDQINNKQRLDIGRLAGHDLRDSQGRVQAVNSAKRFLV
ncbi:hypothetical protein AC579_3789 [Pseudocercospora musae]|uniref:Uncharacterized protein n=1 Tax=Pseudocercospora musae TaxID=113226 RepID=A0A139I151_9PEZI|nr:hypothetical protein AC579_3789 [Pseudocercospora musae]